MNYDLFEYSRRKEDTEGYRRETLWDVPALLH